MKPEQHSRKTTTSVKLGFRGGYQSTRVSIKRWNGYHVIGLSRSFDATWSSTTGSNWQSPLDNKGDLGTWRLGKWELHHAWETWRLGDLSYLRKSLQFVGFMSQRTLFSELTLRLQHLSLTRIRDLPSSSFADSSIIVVLLRVSRDCQVIAKVVEEQQPWTDLDV